MSVFKGITFYRTVIGKWKLITGLLLPLTGVILSEPWIRDNLFDVSYGMLNWFSLMIGPLAGFLVLCYAGYSSLMNPAVFVRMEHSLNGLVHLFFAMLAGSFAVSGEYILIMCLIGLWRGKHLLNWGEGTSTAIIGERQDAIWVFLRTFIDLGIFLMICGLLFLLIAVLFRSVSGAFILPFLIPGLDEANRYIFHDQLIMKYLFPLKTFLYFDQPSFLMGSTILLGMVVLLLVLLSFVFCRTDFLLLRRGDT